MVEDFLKNGGYETEKSEDTSNQFGKINRTEGQKNRKDMMIQKNSSMVKMKLKKKRISLFWMAWMSLILIVKTKISKKMNSIFH